MPTEDMVPRSTSTPFYLDQEEPEFDFAMPATPTVNCSSTISTGTFFLAINNSFTSLSLLIKIKEMCHKVTCLIKFIVTNQLPTHDNPQLCVTSLNAGPIFFSHAGSYKFYSYHYSCNWSQWAIQNTSTKFKGGLDLGPS